MTTAAVTMLHSFFVENVTEIHLGNHVKHEIISGCDKKDLF